MAKQKPNLALAFEDVPVVQLEEKPRANRSEDPSATVLVGANLPPRYARNLAMLHAETGMTKKELLQEAIDDLVIKKGGIALKR